MWPLNGLEEVQISCREAQKEVKRKVAHLGLKFFKQKTVNFKSTNELISGFLPCSGKTATGEAAYIKIYEDIGETV